MNAVLNVTVGTAMMQAICGQVLCGETLCGQIRSAMASEQLITVITPATGIRATLSTEGAIMATITQGPMIVGSCPDYEGPYEIRPAVHAQELETENLRMKQNLLVKEIPYLEVSNTSGGTTVTIG